LNRDVIKNQNRDAIKNQRLWFEQCSTLNEKRVLKITGIGVFFSI